MKKYPLKIARILSPLTLASSARSKTMSFRDEEILFFKEYTIKTFIFTKYKKEWLSLRSIYRKGSSLIWLISLFFNLIKGKFQLFITGLGYPESLVAFIISKIVRRPIIVFSGHWYWQKNLVGNFLWPLSRFIACHSTLLVVLNQRTKIFWESSGISKNRIRVLHYYVSTIDIERKHMTLVENLRRTYGNKKILLFLGRLTEVKGLEYLIKAFAKLSLENRSAVLIIIGDGPEKGKLRNLCNKLKLKNVFFTGEIWDRDLKTAYFLLCDVFVYPSIVTDVPEEWGLAVNEAMSVGKPVIITKAVGCAYDLVKHGVNGLIVPQRSVDELYKAIKMLVEDDALRIAMGKMSREIVYQAFTYINARKNFEECIRAACKLFCK